MKEKSRFFVTLAKSLLLLSIVILAGYLSMITIPLLLKNQEWGYVIVVIIGIILQIYVYRQIYNSNFKMVLSLIFALLAGINLGILTALLELAFIGASILVITITLFVLTIILLIFNIAILFNPNRNFRYYLIIGILILILSVIALTFLMYAKLPYCHPLIIILEFVLIVFCIIEAIQTLSKIKKEIEYGSDLSNEWIYASNITMMVMMTYVEIIRLIVVILGYKKKTN